MFYLAIVLLVLGVIISLASSIVLLVRAFQTSIGWGLVCLLPFGPLAFSLCHWETARGAVKAYVVGVLMLIGSTAISSTERNNQASGSSGQGAPASRRNIATEARPQATVSNPVALREERITYLQGQVARQLDELNVVYRDLTTRRAALKPGDLAGLDTFNKEAARYTVLLEEARKTKAVLDQVMSNP